MIRTAQLADLPRILDIYAHARRFMAETGNAVQWGNSYPPESVVRADIASGGLYVLEEDEGIHAVLVASAGQLGVKNAAVMYPVRIAVSGRAVTPGGAVELCSILGREETLFRLKAGILALTAERTIRNEEEDDF